VTSFQVVNVYVSDFGTVRLPDRRYRSPRPAPGPLAAAQRRRFQEWWLGHACSVAFSKGATVKEVLR